MSDNEDNEDYFGDEAEAEEVVFEAPEEQLEQEEEADLGELFGDDEQEQQPEKEQAAGSKKSEGDARRQALQALAAKAKQGDDSGKKRKKQAKESGASQKRQKKGATAEPADVEDDGELFGHGENDEEPAENDADRQFIDDEGAAPMEEFAGDDEDDEMQPDQYEEAEEVAEGEEEKTFGGKKKRNKAEISGEERKERRFVIRSLIVQMQAAAEKDHEKCAARQPAIHKMAMLKDADAKISNRGWHEDLIEERISAALVTWLEPSHDKDTGKITMPHVKIREAVLRWLDMLPYDTALPDHKEQIKATKIGKYVMFLKQYDLETAANKRMATKIAERWIRPVMHREHDLDRQDDDKTVAKMLERQKAEREQKQQLQRSTHTKEADAKRIHANIPMPSKLDYVVAPKPKFSMDDAGGPGQRPKEKNSFIEKRIRDIGRKNKQADGKGR